MMKRLASFVGGSFCSTLRRRAQRRKRGDQPWSMVPSTCTKKQSQVRIITEGGEVIDRRIPTTRGHLTTLFWGRPHGRILIEASTESEWVAQHLETLGHDVGVADPNSALMY